MSHYKLKQNYLQAVKECWLAGTENKNRLLDQRMNTTKLNSMCE